ncbi:MAG: DUF494 family protein [Candidatus Eisenbacteria bacterium]
MSDRNADGVPRLLRLLAQKLEDFLEGDELALETLGEAIEAGGWSGEELGAVILALRSLSGAGAATGWVAGAPGRDASRVMSAEERHSLSTEAWGYLLGLRRLGALDAEQFERVLDMLTASGVRPVSVEFARDVASRVAMETGEPENPGDDAHGEHEVAH